MPIDDDDQVKNVNHLNKCESQFTFLPLYRVYSFDSGSTPTRTYIMVEVNLPSGVKSDKIWVEVVNNGMELRVTVGWPEYMLDPVKFNGAWLAKSELLLQSSRITSSFKSVQDIRREFGDAAVNSIAHIPLPRKVDDDISSLQISKLGFFDNSSSSLKANGMALQVQLLASEEFSMKLLPSVKSPGFTVVQDEVNTPQTVSPSAISSIASE